MHYYPLSQNEQRIVHWSGRLMLIAAVAVSAFLGAVSWFA